MDDDLVTEVEFGDDPRAFALRDYQHGWMRNTDEDRKTFSRVLGVAATGSGKCLGRGTPVMLFDGHVIPVENVKPGMLLMGPDSRPRAVKSVCQGIENMYRVNPVKGDSYVVNESHILSFKMSGDRYSPRNEIRNVSILEWFGSNKTFKHCAKGWRTGVDFPDSSAFIHPKMPAYMLGLWLGDGTATAFSISKPDPEVEACVREYASSIGHHVSTSVSPSGCPTHNVISPDKSLRGRGNRPNEATNALRSLGLLGFKHVPHAYKISQRDLRLQLLAGILDADGCVSCGGYDFISVYRVLADDVAFIARSLGFAAYISPCKKSCQGGFTGDYFRVSISGDLSVLPVKIPRRKAHARAQKKSVLKTGINIEPVGPGEYFGFEVDGPDHLFLLGDFTVTHNTSFFAAVAASEWAKGGRTLILENRDKLVRQTAKRIATETGLDAEVEMAEDHASPFAPVVVASVQTLCRDARLLGFAEGHFSLVVADESHHALSKSWQKVLNYFHYGADSLADGWVAPVDGEYIPKSHVLGVTATPELGAKQSLAEFYQKQSFQYQYLHAVQDGWLVPPITKNIALKIDLRGLRPGRTPNGSDLQAADLSERLIPVLEALADQIVAEASNRKGIVFVPSIECARILAAAITRKGLNGIFVSGECLDVDEKTEAFVAAGPGAFLCNACLYVEGADFPDISCVVPARATKSVGFYKQQIGRGTRVLPGVVDGLGTPELRRAAIAASAKPNLLILDPLWISDRIDLCDAYDLFTDKPEVKQKMKDSGAPPNAESAREAERDLIKALEKEAKKHAKKQARTIDPLAWAVSIGDSALANWVPETTWDSMPPTAGQIAFLQKQGIDTTNIKYKGMAQKIVGRVLVRLNLRLCTPHQLSFLHKLGVDEQKAATLTAKEASALIDRRLAEKRSGPSEP